MPWHAKTPAMGKAFITVSVIQQWSFQFAYKEMRYSALTSFSSFRFHDVSTFLSNSQRKKHLGIFPKLSNSFFKCLVTCIHSASLYSETCVFCWDGGPVRSTIQTSTITDGTPVNTVCVVHCTSTVCCMFQRRILCEPRAFWELTLRCSFRWLLWFPALTCVCPWWFYNSESSGHILTIITHKKSRKHSFSLKKSNQKMSKKNAEYLLSDTAIC